MPPLTKKQKRIQANRKKSAAVTQKMKDKVAGSATRKEADELARSRAKAAGLIPEKRGSTTGFTRKQLRDIEVKETAQKGLDIKKAKIDIKRQEGLDANLKEVEKAERQEQIEAQSSQLSEAPLSGSVVPITGGDLVDVGLLASGIGAAGLAGKQLIKGIGKKAGKEIGEELAEKGLQKELQHLLETNPLKGLRPSEFAVKRELLAAEFSAKTGGQIAIKDAIRGINTYTKLNRPAFTKLLTSNALKKALGAYISFAGVDVIATWYGLDNVADGNKFSFPDAQIALDNGLRTREDIREFFKETDASYQLALEQIERSARYNVLNFPAKKLFLAGIKLKKKQYDLKKDNFIFENGL